MLKKIKKLISKPIENNLEESPIEKIKKNKTNNNIDLNDAINVECRIQNDNLLKKKTKQIQDLMFKLQVKDFEDNSNRLGLDLILLLDISTSMRGEKIKFLKETCYFIIDQLTENDRISIITYDNQTELINNFLSLNSQNKEIIKKNISNLSVRGSTNIKSAIEHGFKVINNRKYKNDVISMFFLTDGADTCGNSNEMIIDSFTNNFNYTKNKLKQNVLINTFGFGSDHDEKILISLSNINEGNFFYIKDIDMIEDCFIECLGPMVSILVKNAKLIINFKNNITINRVYNKSFELNKIININSIGEGMRRFYFCNINIPNSDIESNEFEICEIELIGETTLNENNEFILKKNFKIKLVNNDNEIGNLHKDFETEFTKLKIAEDLKEYKNEIKAGNLFKGKQKMKEKISNYKNNNYIDNNLLMNFENNMNCKDFDDVKMISQQEKCLKIGTNFKSKNMANYNPINMKTKKMYKK